MFRIQVMDHVPALPFDREWADLETLDVGRARVSPLALRSPLVASLAHPPSMPEPLSDAGVS